MYTFASCQTFAGGFDMGMVQADFKFVHKVEQEGGFGMANTLVNKHLLGDFTHQVSSYQEWYAPNVDVIAANPPCSGFSLMTDNRWRGTDAKVNSCMWALMDYAARVKPSIVIMESVRQAFTGGRELMLALRRDLEEKSGIRYNLFHVMQDALELGGAAKRPRYFWTAVREDLPFGVDYPVGLRTPTFWDTISDLHNIPQTWEYQPHRRPASWWTMKSARYEDLPTFDGHHMAKVGMGMRRAFDLLDAAEDCGIGWPHGWWISKVAKAVYEKTGSLPPSWDTQVEKLKAKDWHMGFTTVTRWRPDQPARVITGGALQLVVHPYERRTITHREAARVMGFPDSWRIKPLRHMTMLPATWGKGITVQCGKWIGEQAKNALDGNPGSTVGDEIGAREWLVTSPGTRVKPPALSDDALQLAS